MRVRSRLATLLVCALSQSMHVDPMEKVARMVIPDYDLQKRLGFPAAIPITPAIAARRILKDVAQDGYVLRLIESLIDVTSHGDMGREVRIPLLPRIIAEVEEHGYRYSEEKGVFLEDGDHRRTMGWGTLREGRTYEFALLRVDIAHNSRLVRRYSRESINTAFSFVRNLVTRTVEKREGRIWNWEGDGGLAAFYFNDKNIKATLSGMEILHEMLMHNLLARELPEPVLLRLAVHAGPCRFLRSASESAGDTIRRVEILESDCTRPGCLTVSPGVFIDLGSKLSPLFTAVTGPDVGSVYRYDAEWEKK